MTHGTGSGYVMGCRCAACTAANTARVREYRKRRKESVPSGSVVTTSLEPQTSDPGDVGASRGLAPGR